MKTIIMCLDKEYQDWIEEKVFFDLTGKKYAAEAGDKKRSRFLNTQNNFLSKCRLTAGDEYDSIKEYIWRSRNKLPNNIPLTFRELDIYANVRDKDIREGYLKGVHAVGF